MNSKKYKVAIIGTGRIGFTLGFDKKREQPASHTFAVNKNPRLELLWGCDTNSENLTLWKKHNPKAKVYSNTKDLFLDKSVNPDIIVVAVNEDSHLDCAISAIESKPSLVILEKPVALNSIEAEKIKICAKENNVPVLVNHERRFALDYKIASEWISKIGELQFIDARLFSGLRVYRKEDEETGFYSLLHDGTHLVDIVLYLLSFAKKTVSSESLLSNPKLVSIFKDEKDAVRNLRVNFQNDFCKDVSFNFSGRSKFFGFEVDIVGTEGRIYIGNGFAKIYLRKESKLYTGFYSLTKQKIKFPKKTLYFANMVQNAVDFLDGESELKSTLDTGIETLQILEQIKTLIE